MAGRVKLSLLVVGTHPVCKDLASYVRVKAALVDFPSNFDVDVCERVKDVQEVENFFMHDYVVLTVDPRNTSSLEDVRRDACRLEKHLLTGRVCLVNIFCKTRSGIDFEDLFTISTQLNAPIIIADCSTREGSVYLAKRIVCAASAALGVKNGIPFPL